MERKTFSEEAIAELQKYSWPGNVRELRNVVERLVLLAETAEVSQEDVQLTLPAGAAGGQCNLLRSMERALWRSGRKALKKKSSSRRFGATIFT